nr:LLM class flavin-dependent oxidoreductase [Roseomonas acroporae]
MAGWTREATAGDPRDFLALFEAADRMGFDGVWFSEFRFRRALPYPSTLLLAAALLARTERLRVGTSVLVLALHHPLLLAEEIAQLDRQCGGRLDIGIGRGTDPETFRALGIGPEEVRERFEEAHGLLVRAWTQPAVTARGRFWSFEGVPVGPEPVQRPHPPLHVAAASRGTLEFALRHDLPLLLSLEPPEGRQLALYRTLLAERGGEGALGRSSLARYVCIGRDAAEARARLERLLPGLDRRRRHFAALRGTPPDAVPPADPARFLREQAICGDPEACHAQIRALLAGTGIGALRCVFNGNGVLDDGEALAGMALFAREVLPALRKAG